MMRSGFCLLLLLFIPFVLLAQSFKPDPDWRFDNYSSQNHFLSREINNITIDKHGYVWVCSSGVQRFDGYKTIDFNSHDQAKGGLRDNSTNIISDNTGRVWVSSAGLCYYDDTSGKFIYVDPGSNHKITDVYAPSIQGNYLWFVCNYGLAKLNLLSLKISFTSLVKITDPLGTYIIDENTLLISSREKAYIYNIKKDIYSSKTLIYNHSLLKIFSVAKSGAVIFLGTNLGLFEFKNLNDVTFICKDTKDLMVDDLLFLPQDKEKKYLFLATGSKGIMVYNRILKKVEFAYMHDDDNPGSLPNNIVSKLYPDKNGRLWVSTSLGIRLDLSNQQLKMRFLDKNNLDEQSVDKISQDKYDSSKVWMSSYNQGMILINWKTKTIEKIFDTNPEMSRILDFAQLPHNKWLLVTPKKIIEWGPRVGILSETQLPVPDSLRLVYNFRRIIMDGVDTCFITTNKGLFKYDLTTHKITTASINNKPGTKDDPSKYDLIDGFCDKGILWIASRNGLFSYDITKHITNIYRGEGEKLDYFFFDITNTANNQIVCAAGSGITIFDKQTKSFKVVNSIANLFKPNCENVVSINNVAWIGTEDGILNYDLNTNKSARADHEIPLMDLYPTSPFMVIGNDIVVGFRNGYAWFTPDQKNILVSSDPVIERVYVNNQPVLNQYPTETNTGKLVFSHSDNSINIAFTAFLYSDPDHIYFRYKLNGADSRWQYAADQRSADYAQLEPGDYTFYVQSGNKNGVWNNHLASFNFMIQPPYWETWWFRTLVVLLITLVLYRLYRYRVKNILAIERIRERIASDFHDDIGSALSSISIFSEVADKQLKQQLPPEQISEILGHISFHSRAMLEAMDDIVWAVNPKNDHFNDLAVRMREFAIPLLEARNIHFDINIQEDVLNTRIKMEARKNIFLIFKECVNNILKHAECSAMNVAVSKLNNQLELIISDNGKGFDSSARHNRNGLKNMQKRASEINGTIHLATQKGNGTITRLLVNII